MTATPQIVGVVNVTEDSFSDGGRYLAPADALAHARRLRREGADIIELGPASSHPDAQRVTAGEERHRLAPVLRALVADDVPVSVDSYLPDTQRFALAHGARYLNDIQGFPDAALYPMVREADCTLVVMHSIQRTGPATRVYTDPDHAWASIERFFTGRLGALEAAGIARERLVIDPGLGFFLGSNPEPSLVVLGGIRRLKDRFGLPVLVSPSRKSFLQRIVGRAAGDVGPATLAAELYAARQGVDYIRTHDVGTLHDALIVQAALTGEDHRDLATTDARAERSR
jgi:dihydropteroate synthase type 2